jgi:hypothetical protein
MRRRYPPKPNQPAHRLAGDCKNLVRFSPCSLSLVCLSSASKADSGVLSFSLDSISGTDAGFNYELSYLPGQRLSRCTCPKFVFFLSPPSPLLTLPSANQSSSIHLSLSSDKTHPGPKHPDGTWVGRSAPEVDTLPFYIFLLSYHLTSRSVFNPIDRCH